MNRTRTATILGIISLSISACLIYMLLFHRLILALLNWDHDPPSPISKLFNSGLFTPWFISVYLMTCYGWDLFKDVNKSNIKGAVGGLAVFGYYWIILLIDFTFLQQNRQTSLLSFFSSLLAMLIVLLFYIFTSKFVMKKEGLIPDEKGEFIGRGILFLLAFQVFALSYNIIVAYAPKKIDGYYLTPGWDLTSVLLPVFLAIVIYNIGVKLFVKKREKVTSF